jgi:hypothetical protein
MGIGFMSFMGIEYGGDEKTEETTSIETTTNQDHAQLTSETE